MNKLKPRYLQIDALNAILDYISDNPGKYPVVVLPTGSGKSFFQALVVEYILSYPDTRILLLSHQQELLLQNAEEINNYLQGNVDIGIYSAGLKRREYKNRVIIGGIQSVYKKAWTHIGFRDFILIDEVHLVNHKNSGMYRTFLNDMVKINPKIAIAGMTATAYRTGSGIITEGEDAFFDDICYEVSIKELIDPNHFRNRDKKQYLCNLISKSAVNKADLTDVHIRGGEYVPGEMERAYMTGDLVCRAVKEIKEYTEDRKKVLVFCAGITHCENVYQKMIAIGMNANYVHSRQADDLNQKNLALFKNGELKYLLNIGILTTGYNVKDIDCIVLLRSTCSPGLYYQMAGRGLRMHPGKTDCLILDFGKNAEKHGPLDKIEIVTKNGKSEIGTMPQKECPNCHILLFLASMECPECGYIFPQKEKHDDKASTADILSKYKPPEKVDIDHVTYSKHERQGKIPSLRVDYHISPYVKYSEWICIDHTGYARQKAVQWLKRVTTLQIDSVDDALDYSACFLVPEKVIVNINDKYPRIVGYIYPEKKKEEHEETENLEMNNGDLEKLIF